MGLSTNVFLNKAVIGLGKIGNGEMKTFCIHLLYDFYKSFPPECVKTSRQYYQNHKKEIKKVISILEDEESKRIYRSMIEFRSTYDRKKHPGFTTDDIYFIKDLIKLNEHEIFVDAGGCKGDTIDSFLKSVKNKYDRIVVFEPDRMNFKELEVFGRKRKNIVLHNSGLWSEKRELVFEGYGNECSKIVNCPGGV